MQVFIITVLVAVFYGLCIGGVIVEYKCVTDDFPDTHADAVDVYEFILLLLVILFAPVCCIAGGVVCIYSMLKKTTKDSMEE